MIAVEDNSIDKNNQLYGETGARSWTIT